MTHNALRVFKINPEAKLPVRKTEEAAGYDLCTIEDFTLWPGQRIVVGTGLVVQPPPGYHTEILLRSGMAYKYNIMLINSVGLIDRDYAGPTDELKLMLYRAPEFSSASLQIDLKTKNPDLRSYDPVSFSAGDRVAQLVLRKTETLDVLELAEAPARDRGGLGSTGHK